MKEIKAVIQPGKLEKLREELTDHPEFPGMTVTRVEGCGPYESENSWPLGIRHELTDFSPKIRIEILAPDQMVDTIVETIHRITHTGQVGDGVVWVTNAEQFHRLRAALTSK